MKRLALFLSVLLPLAAAAQEVIEVTLREGTNMALALSPDGDVTIVLFFCKDVGHRRLRVSAVSAHRSTYGRAGDGCSSTELWAPDGRKPGVPILSRRRVALRRTRGSLTVRSSIAGNAPALRTT